MSTYISTHRHMCTSLLVPWGHALCTLCTPETVASPSTLRKPIPNSCGQQPLRAQGGCACANTGCSGGQKAICLVSSAWLMATDDWLYMTTSRVEQSCFNSNHDASDMRQNWCFWRLLTTWCWLVHDFRHVMNCVRVFCGWFYSSRHLHPSLCHAIPCHETSRVR